MLANGLASLRSLIRETIFSPKSYVFYFALAVIVTLYSLVSTTLESTDRYLSGMHPAYHEPIRMTSMRVAWLSEWWKRLWDDRDATEFKEISRFAANRGNTAIETWLVFDHETPNAIHPDKIKRAGGFFLQEILGGKQPQQLSCPSNKSLRERQIITARQTTGQTNLACNIKRIQYFVIIDVIQVILAGLIGIFSILQLYHLVHTARKPEASRIYGVILPALGIATYFGVLCGLLTNLWASLLLERLPDIETSVRWLQISAVVTWLLGWSIFITILLSFVHLALWKEIRNILDTARLNRVHIAFLAILALAFQAAQGVDLVRYWLDNPLQAWASIVSLLLGGVVLWLNGRRFVQLYRHNDDPSDLWLPRFYLIGVILLFGSALVHALWPLYLYQISIHKTYVHTTTIALIFAGPTLLIVLALGIFAALGRLDQEPIEFRNGVLLFITVVCLLIGVAVWIWPIPFPRAIGTVSIVMLFMTTASLLLYYLEAGLLALYKGKYSWKIFGPLAFLIRLLGDGAKKIGAQTAPVLTAILVIGTGMTFLIGPGEFHEVRRFESVSHTATGSDPNRHPAQIDWQDAWCHWLKVNRVPDPGGGERTIEHFRQRDCFRGRREARAIPLVFISSEGGGIRAAYWTVMVLKEFMETEVKVGPKQVAGYLKAPLRLDSIFAMSGVSGGALGVISFAALWEEEYFRSRARVEKKILGGDYLSPAVASLLFRAPVKLIFPWGRVDDRAVLLEKSWEESWQENCTEKRGGKKFLRQNCGLRRSFSDYRFDPDDDTHWRPLLISNGVDVNSGSRVNTTLLNTDCFNDLTREEFHMLNSTGVMLRMLSSEPSANAGGEWDALIYAADAYQMSEALWRRDRTREEDSIQWIRASFETLLRTYLNKKRFSEDRIQAEARFLREHHRSRALKLKIENAAVNSLEDRQALAPIFLKFAREIWNVVPEWKLRKFHARRGIEFDHPRVTIDRFAEYELRPEPSERSLALRTRKCDVLSPGSKDFFDLRPDDIAMSTAALLSARFPLVSPTGFLPASRYNSAEIVDGGYYDNSGSLANIELFTHLAPFVRDYNRASGNKPRLQPVYIQISNKYRSQEDLQPEERTSFQLLAPIVGILNSRVYQTARAEGLVRDALACFPAEHAHDDDLSFRLDPYYYVDTVAIPGARAPLGWILSETAQEELRAQLKNYEINQQLLQPLSNAYVVCRNDRAHDPWLAPRERQGKRRPDPR